MADIQTEKAFRKQDGLNLYNKYLLYGEKQPMKTVVKKKKEGSTKKKTMKMKTVRYFKKIGLGINTPSDAIKGNYIDKHSKINKKLSKIKERNYFDVTFYKNKKKTLLTLTVLAGQDLIY